MSETANDSDFEDFDESPGYFGGLTPKEAGKKSGEVRRGQEIEITDIKAMGPQLLKELVQAAYGRGRWSKLEPSKRLVALVKANEYINGRPVPMKAEEEEADIGGFRVGQDSSQT